MIDSFDAIHKTKSPKIMTKKLWRRILEKNVTLQSLVTKHRKLQPQLIDPTNNVVEKTSTFTVQFLLVSNTKKNWVQFFATPLCRLFEEN